VMLIRDHRYTRYCVAAIIQIKGSVSKALWRPTPTSPPKIQPRLYGISMHRASQYAVTTVKTGT
jgi:hypothetical protein